MAHRIHVEDGKASMMYVGQEPWHGLGTKLNSPATAAEAIEAANLNWTVMKVPLYAWGEKFAYPMEDCFTVVPEHLWGTEKCPTFGVVGPHYTPLQNHEAFGFFDPIVKADEAIYHTAGALDDGRRVWLLAKLPDDIKVAGKDIVHKYLLLSNSHDGSGSVQIKFTPVRVVCHNTLTMALKEGETSIRVPHTRDLMDRLELARQNLNLIKTGYASIETDFATMAETRIDDTRLAKYVKLVFPDPKTKERRDHDRVAKDRARACVLFKGGKGNDQPGVVGTLWAAYNGIAEMVDHVPSRRTPGQHLDYIWFGGGYGAKARAFSVAKQQMETEWKAR
jgi:phage/plasmid-like protein (TIGR03299 family)